MTEDERFLTETLALILRALISPDERPDLIDGLAKEVIATLTDTLARRPTPDECGAHIEDMLSEITQELRAQFFEDVKRAALRRLQ